MRGAFDIAVVGSGFAGSLFSILARRLGRSVVLVERGTHPRFAIGESSSPLANLLLEELCDHYGLGRIRPLAAWGSWQRTYPEVGCGLKRGFTFYGHRAGEPFGRDPMRRDQLLVAASPHDEVADTHWYRADFDHFLVREAQREGVEYFDRTNLDRFEESSDGVALGGSREDQPVRLRARLLVDASGPRGFLHHALRLPESSFPSLPAIEGLYSHFEGVRRIEDLEAFSVGPGEYPPYPADDAAVHHVFEDGWIWVLRFNNGLTSAGVAAAPPLARRLRLAEGEAGWQRLLARFPSVQEVFAGSRATRPFVHAPRLAFRSAVGAGGRWILLPSAAAFIDPILSTGIPLTLRGLQRLARVLEEQWERPGLESSLSECASATLSEADTAALLVASLYASFADFELFAALTLLYFAAASYAEAARRLGRGELAGSFLSADHSVFGTGLRACCLGVLDASARRALACERAGWIARIYETIGPLDVAGLADRSRRNWHPVDAESLFAAAPKLDVTRGRIAAMLEKTGFFSPSGLPVAR